MHLFTLSLLDIREKEENVVRNEREREREGQSSNLDLLFRRILGIQIIISGYFGKFLNEYILISGTHEIKHSYISG